MKTIRAAAVLLALLLCHPARADDSPAPRTERYDSGGARVDVRITEPMGASARSRPAILLFHGGGWSEGEASWMDAVAEQYAALGFVAVSVEYRLSKDGVTPFDAVEDARNAIRWVRADAVRLGIDARRVVALGTSAGAHLAASTAIFDEPSAGVPSSVPDALVLRSPAVSVEASGWFRRLAGGRAQAAALSPSLHIRRGLPPMLLLQGAEDNVTPAADARVFCDRMRAQGNTCELEIYPGVGHLFTRNLGHQEIPDYASIDRPVGDAAHKATLAFLERHGFLGETQP